MKSVLISIQPKWCELIASGEKTVELRKTNPKIETPFKCYIYETKALYKPNGCKCLYVGKGKVIGEFVCDEVIKIGNYQEVDYSYMLWVKDRKTTEKLCKDACLDEFEIQAYLGANGGFGWHISDLVIYDKPRELSEFYNNCDGHCFDSSIKHRCIMFNPDNPCVCNHIKPLKRPPQSWCYCVVLEAPKGNTMIIPKFVFKDGESEDTK